jgi:hypothetical protein
MDDSRRSPTGARQRNAVAGETVRPAQTGDADVSPAIDIHALATPSHAEMLERWFLPTMPAGLQPVIHHRDAEPVEYARGDWHRVVGQKLDIILDTIASREHDVVFIMSDVDVCFYGAIAEDLRQRMRERDVLFQNNRPSLPETADSVCSGFMVIRVSTRTRDFFERARRVLTCANSATMGDQRACIAVLRASPDLVRWAFLPVTYWSPGDPRGRWEPGVSLTPPPGLLLHHANHTIGVDNKLAQLRAVSAVMEQRRLDSSG